MALRDDGQNGEVRNCKSSLNSSIRSSNLYLFENNKYLVLNCHGTPSVEHLQKLQPHHSATEPLGQAPHQLLQKHPQVLFRPSWNCPKSAIWTEALLLRAPMSNNTKIQNHWWSRKRSFLTTRRVSLGQVRARSDQESPCSRRRRKLRIRVLKEAKPSSMITRDISVYLGRPTTYQIYSLLHFDTAKIRTAGSYDRGYQWLIDSYSVLFLWLFHSHHYITLFL